MLGESIGELMWSAPAYGSTGRMIAWAMRLAAPGAIRTCSRSGIAASLVDGRSIGRSARRSDSLFDVRHDYS